MVTVCASRGIVISSTTSREPHRGQRSRLSNRESGKLRHRLYRRPKIRIRVV
jgi:hypothetical protein